MVWSVRWGKGDKYREGFDGEGFGYPFRTHNEARVTVAKSRTGRDEVGLMKSSVIFR